LSDNLRSGGAARLLPSLPGTRAEPIGNDFAGSTIRCLEGASKIPGQAEALKN
jgi:hypothetical protein